jgi:hypothetical protein
MCFQRNHWLSLGVGSGEVIGFEEKASAAFRNDR